MIDKTGADCLQFRQVEAGKEPLIDLRHIEAMVRDLYRAGWSYQLIAQFGAMTNEAVYSIITRPDPELAP